MPRNEYENEPISTAPGVIGIGPDRSRIAVGLGKYLSHAPWCHLTKPIAEEKQKKATPLRLTLACFFAFLLAIPVRRLSFIDSVARGLASVDTPAGRKLAALISHTVSAGRAP